MKKNFSNGITILAALLIIIIGIGVINIYASYKQNNRLDKVWSVPMQKDGDISFEKKIFEDASAWDISTFKESNIPEKYDTLIHEISMKCGITNFENIRIYNKDRQYVIAVKENGIEVKVYIDENQRRFEFFINDSGKTDSSGTKEKGMKQIEQEKEDRNSELYSLMNQMLQGCINGGIVPEKVHTVKAIMEEFQENSIFVHNEKIYVTYSNNDKYIVLIYDYKNEYYCAGKLFFGE